METGELSKNQSSLFRLHRPLPFASSLPFLSSSVLLHRDQRWFTLLLWFSSSRLSFRHLRLASWLSTSTALDGNCCRLMFCNCMRNDNQLDHVCKLLSFPCPRATGTSFVTRVTTFSTSWQNPSFGVGIASFNNRRSYQGTRHGCWFGHDGSRLAILLKPSSLSRPPPILEVKWQR